MALAEARGAAPAVRLGDAAAVLPHRGPELADGDGEPLSEPLDERCKRARRGHPADGVLPSGSAQSEAVAHQLRLGELPVVGS